jgi:tryptophanase
MIQSLGKWMKEYLSEVVSSRNAKAKELQSALIQRETIRKKNKDAGEDVSDEDQRKQENAEEQATILEEIVARLNYTEAFMKYSMDDMIKQSKTLIGKIEVLKKKLEAGDTTLPQESFMDYFVSPLH